MTITRLFDIAAQNAHEKPDGIMFGAKESGRWRTYTNQEIWETARRLSAGLNALGISRNTASPVQQEKIILISPNRPEWIITDLAVQLSGAVLTPLYPTSGLPDLEYILREAAVRIAFIADQDLYDRYHDVLQKCGIKHIFSFEETGQTVSWKTLLHQPEEAGPGPDISGNTLATIIYTSGTTGSPKGVMLSHRNMVSNIQDSLEEFYFVSEGDRTLSFLPLNHVFERTVVYLCMHAHVSVYFAESMETIGENLREVQPVAFTTVPRLLEKVYERIISKGLKLKGISRLLFFWALRLGQAYDNQHYAAPWYRIQLWLARKLVFSKWRAALGGKVRAIITGSAACQERLLRIFTAADIVIMEGYGLTEASPVVSVNHFNSRERYIGTVGLPIKNVRVKIAADGEVLVQGDNVMLGYYKQPELTTEALREGWLYTGDIGSWVEGKFLKLTDRKKEIFKTSGGKYVAPQPIENKMKESVFIDQVMVVGENRKYITALVVPAFDMVRSYLHERRMSTPPENTKLVQTPEVMELLRQQINKHNQQFSRVEQIKEFVLLPEAWSIEKGELTPSLKLRRKVIEANCRERIAAMYT